MADNQTDSKSDLEKGDSFASGVAEHYNKVEQKSLKERRRSEIIGIRQFNNAFKSLIIQQAKDIFQTTGRATLQVLDLGCGKGGDLIKYDKMGARLVFGVDIADVSIEQCKKRFADMRKRPEFVSKFIVADLTRELIDYKTEMEDFSKLGYRNHFSHAFSQFSIHYSFESFSQANTYISNAASNLEPGSLFCGTYPDGPKLVKLARESETPGTYKYGDIVEVKFDTEDLKSPKPFGTKYHFKLKEVVDCPEFLVHPKVLDQIMTDNGFGKVFDRSFEQYLINQKNSFETETIKRFYKIFADIYKVAKPLDQLYTGAPMTFDEETWTVVCLYRVFMYRKDTLPIF